MIGEAGSCFAAPGRIMICSHVNGHDIINSKIRGEGEL